MAVVAASGIEFSYFGPAQNASTIALANGHFLVAWAGQAGDLELATYNASGTLVTTATLATPSSSDYFFLLPELLNVGSGQVALSWTSYTPSSGETTIALQTFDIGSLGGLTFSPTEVVDAAIGSQLNSSMIALGSGRFVTTWFGNTDVVAIPGDSEVSMQIADINTPPIDTADIILSDDDEVTLDFFSGVTALADGGFIASWLDEDSVGDSHLQGRIYNNDGSPRGSVFNLADTTSAVFGAAPAIAALSGGGFVAAWPAVTTTDSNGLVFRTFEADGTPRSAITLANTANSSTQFVESIAALEDGGFAIGWTSCSCFGDPPSSIVRIFNADGTARTAEISVPHAAIPAVEALEDGRLVVAWSFLDSSSFYHIAVQVYNRDGSSRYAGDVIVNGTTYDPFGDKPEITELSDGGIVVQAQTGSFTTYGQVFHFINDAPSSSNATATTLEDTAYTLKASDFAFGDSNGDVFGGVVVNAVPSGKLILNGIAVSAGQVIASADIVAGKLVWTPPENGNGTALTALSFSVRDSEGASSIAYSLSFNVTAVNDAPVLEYLGPATTPENRKLVMDVLTDATDGDGDPLSVTAASLVTGFGKLTINNDGTLTYDPTKAPNQDIAEGESKTVTISYTVSDGKGGQTTDEIDVTVEGVSPDIIRGTAKRDNLTGTSGDDRILGLANKDHLDGRGGDDVLKGGKHADIFVFGADYGRDTIVDFKPEDGDRIDLSDAVGITNFKDLMQNHIDDVGKNLVITADDGSVLVLRRVDLDDLDRDSFLF